MQGQLTDSTGAAVEAATVSLVSEKDTLTTLSNAKGQFFFRQVKAVSFTISVHTLEFEAFKYTYIVDDTTDPFQLPAIKLKRKSHVLKEVIIRSPPPVLVKQDTVEYDVAQFEKDEHATVEDVIKKLPGLDLDLDGNLTMEGLPIRELRINGNLFSGADLKTAIEMLPAELIQKIQVVDDYGELARLSGIKTGNPRKILNLKVDPERNKFFYSNGSMGMASTGRLNGSLNTNYMHNDRQVNAMGSLQNSGGEGGTNSSNRSLGLNFHDRWGKKLKVSGGINHSGNDLNLLRESVRQSFYEQEVIVQSNNTRSSSGSKGLGADVGFEFNPNDRNFLRFSSNLAFNKSHSESNTNYLVQRDSLLTEGQELDLQQLRKLEEGISQSRSDLQNTNLAANLTWNHRFAKRGRNATVMAGYSAGENVDEQILKTQLQLFGQDQVKDSLQNRLLDNTALNRSFNASIFYVEPLSEESSLSLNYMYSYAWGRQNRITQEIPETENAFVLDSLSSRYVSTTISQQLGLNFDSKKGKLRYGIGLNAFPTVLEGATQSTRDYSNRRSNFNASGAFRGDYAVSETAQATFNYQANTQQPSLEQLQPISDVSDPRYIVIGNPNLRPAIQHTLNASFRKSQKENGAFWSTNLSVGLTQNKIVQNTVLLDEGLGLRQETYYLNQSGDTQLGVGYSYGRSLKDKKYQLNLHGGANYSNNVSYSNNQENWRRNWSLSQGLNLRMTPAKWSEVSARVNYAYQNDSYQLSSSFGSKISSWRLGLDGRAFFWNRALTLSANLNKNFEQGYARNFRNNPFLVNASITGRFLKKRSASFSISGYDLLDQNTSISRSASGNTITDNRSRRVSRYFMVSVQMKLLNYNKDKKG